MKDVKEKVIQVIIIMVAEEFPYVKNGVAKMDFSILKNGQMKIIGQKD